MQSKSLLIAIAAFAVTASGVHAYGGAKTLLKAGLTQEQVLAFEEARELKSSGDITAARDKLVEAGIDEETIHALHKAAKETRKSDHHKRHRAIIDEMSSEQREALWAAKSANDKESVKAILREAGIGH